jgi:hypothetical protein
MKNKKKPSTSSVSSAATDVDDKSVPKKPAQDESPTANDLGQGIDRPGFDLGGSSGGTHAGTFLGLGKDAFDTPDERRLPGRQPDNKLTIPRWGGPEPHGTTAPAKKPSHRETQSAPKTKKGR